MQITEHSKPKTDPPPSQKTATFACEKRGTLFLSGGGSILQSALLDHQKQF